MEVEPHHETARAMSGALADRAAAQDLLTVIRDDVSALRKLAEDRKEHDNEDRGKRVAREAAQEIVRQQEIARGAPGKRRVTGDD